MSVSQEDITKLIDFSIGKQALIVAYNRIQKIKYANPQNDEDKKVLKAITDLREWIALKNLYDYICDSTYKIGNKLSALEQDIKGLKLYIDTINNSGSVSLKRFRAECTTSVNDTKTLDSFMRDFMSVLTRDMPRIYDDGMKFLNKAEAILKERISSLEGQKRKKADEMKNYQDELNNNFIKVFFNAAKAAVNRVKYIFKDIQSIGPIGKEDRGGPPLRLLSELSLQV
ncbi:hypothetical protein PCO87_05450 [Pectobacteriaceae bacterium C52]|nr:hypothetical protein PCO87_05450 [Pectobacteriaceae bacterium C52]